MKNNLPLIITVLYYYIILIISVLYAYFLMNIPMDGIMDRDNYLRYALSSSEIWTFYDPISRLFNEPLWLQLNINLYILFNNQETVVKFYVFFSSMIMSFIVLRQNKKYFIYLLGIVFLWQVMTNYVVHLRQGVAITIFLLAYFNKNKNIRLFFYLLTPFIHTSFFIVLALILFSTILKKSKLSLQINYLLQFSSYTIFSLFILSIALYLGARQGELYLSENSISFSGFGFIYWLLILFIFISEKPSFQLKNNLTISFILFYLASYFTLPVVGRIFEDVLILILLSALDLSENKQKIFFMLFTIYFLFQSNIIFKIIGII